MPTKELKFKKIGVIGLGYVGIPLALRFSEVGLNVIGFDINEKLIAMLNSGKSPIKHISNDSIEMMKGAGFFATNDFSKIPEVDAIIICVPTPLTKHNEPDLSYIESTLGTILPHLRAGQAISLESTTWPGTTEEVIRPKVEALGFEIGKDIFLVYSPEREDPGNESFEVRTIPKIVSGSTNACKTAAIDIYSQVVDQVVPVSSTRAGEMVKLLENIHRSINIGLVNEMKVVTDRLGIDIFEVVDAAATKPFGFKAYYPGPGIGGHCIPIDPFYLTWKAKEVGLHTRFIELAGEINRAMPQYVVDKLISGLNAAEKSLKGAKVLALGIAYKKNVDDMRESPSIDVMELIQAWGADVQYSDPNIPVFPETREHYFDLQSVDLTKESLADFDAVVFLTDHSAFDLEMIAKHSSLIIDTRGQFDPNLPNVIRA